MREAALSCRPAQRISFGLSWKKRLVKRAKIRYDKMMKYCPGG